MGLMIPLTQEYKGALKVVKVETDANKGLVEKYKVCAALTWACSIVVEVDGHERLCCCQCYH